MKKFLATTSVLTVLAACGPGTDGADPIRLGLIAPLTGDAASLGSDVLNGAKLAAEEINAAGGIGGRMIELIAEDGRCAGSDAASAAQKLVNVDKVLAIVGGLCSGETLAAAPIVEAAKVVLLSPTSSSPDVTNAGDFIFRDYPSDALKTRVMAKYFGEKEWKRVAVISTNADFSVGFRTALTGDVGSGGIAFSETVEPDTKDFRSVLTRLKDTEFDVFVPNTHQPAGMALLIAQFRELGFTQPIVTHDVGDDQTVWKTAGAAAEGMQIINVPSMGEDTPFGQSFIAKFGKPQAGLFFAAYSYDAVRVLAGIIEGGAMDGPAIRDGLYKTTAFPGIIGTFGFDKNGDVTGAGYALKEVQDGMAKDVAPMAF